jgi:membrane protein YqaA with SNARE-associated domain
MHAMTRSTTHAETGPEHRGKMGRAKDRLDDAARGRWALPFLFLGSVLESTVFPWPVEFPMIAYMLRGKRATVEVVIVCVLGSVVGSALFYLVGRAAFEALEGFIQARPGLQSSFETARAWVEDYGALAVFATTLAPVPVQMASLAAGLSELAVWAFLLAVAAGRAVRYGAMGVLLYVFGDDITRWWSRQPRRRKRFATVLILGVFAVLLGWAVYSLVAPAL